MYIDSVVYNISCNVRGWPALCCCTLQAVAVRLVMSCHVRKFVMIRVSTSLVTWCQRWYILSFSWFSFRWRARVTASAGVDIFISRNKWQVSQTMSCESGLCTWSQGMLKNVVIVTVATTVHQHSVGCGLKTTILWFSSVLTQYLFLFCLHILDCTTVTSVFGFWMLKTKHDC